MEDVLKKDAVCVKEESWMDIDETKADKPPDKPPTYEEAVTHAATEAGNHPKTLMLALIGISIILVLLCCSVVPMMLFSFSRGLDSNNGDYSHVSSSTQMTSPENLYIELSIGEEDISEGRCPVQTLISSLWAFIENDTAPKQSTGKKINSKDSMRRAPGKSNRNMPFLSRPKPGSGKGKGNYNQKPKRPLSARMRRPKIKLVHTGKLGFNGRLLVGFGAENIVVEEIGKPGHLVQVRHAITREGQKCLHIKGKWQKPCSGWITPTSIPTGEVFVFCFEDKSLHVIQKDLRSEEEVTTNVDVILGLYSEDSVVTCRKARGGHLLEVYKTEDWTVTSQVDVMFPSCAMSICSNSSGWLAVVYPAIDNGFTMTTITPAGKVYSERKMPATASPLEANALACVDDLVFVGNPRGLTFFSWSFKVVGGVAVDALGMELGGGDVINGIASHQPGQLHVSTGPLGYIDTLHLFHVT